MHIEAFPTRGHVCQDAAKDEINAKRAWICEHEGAYTAYIVLREKNNRPFKLLVGYSCRMHRERIIHLGVAELRGFSLYTLHPHRRLWVSQHSCAAMR